MQAVIAPREAPTAGDRIARPYELGGGWYRFYDAMLPLAALLLKAASPFEGRLRSALEGRRKAWRIEREDDRPLVLIHTASRGEFEGVMPLLDRLHSAGKVRLALSYSSSSVEKAVSARSDLAACGYLPLDFLDHQLRFLARLEPVLLLISKHDFWPNMLRAAAALNIPTILLNANFHRGSRRHFPFVKGFSRSHMKFLSAVWAVSDEDAGRARVFLDERTDLAVLGDTRYDQVLRRAEEGGARFASLREALGVGPVVIAGSSWEPDERIFYPVFAELQRKNPNARLVVAPHEVTSESLERNIESARREGLGVLRFSEWTGGAVEAEVLLVDRMGVLAQVYAVGDMAWVGGGFGKGLHSVLEPAACGLPVAFGPRHYVAHEAGLLIASGGGFVIMERESLQRLWGGWLASPETLKEASGRARQVVRERSGATDRILERLQTYLPA
ncbi:MAG: hypothetical protein FJY67_00615 [Calditrichaeota bacterium]|nr:hypothetical protein [Calditrichota bacterium]